MNDHHWLLGWQSLAKEKTSWARLVWKLSIIFLPKDNDIVQIDMERLVAFESYAGRAIQVLEVGCQDREGPVQLNISIKRKGCFMYSAMPEFWSIVRLQDSAFVIVFWCLKSGVHLRTSKDLQRQEGVSRPLRVQKLNSLFSNEKSRAT